MRPLLFCCFILSYWLAGAIDRPGHFFIHNYTKAQYNAHSQNWSLDQDTVTGYMYAGNSMGLLRYDGTRWRVYPLPNRMIVRSVRCDHNGRIYVGGFEEFGYFETLEEGTLKYNSLSDSVPVPFTPNEEIWKIYIKENSVYFQSFTTVYHYTLSGQVSVHRAPAILLFLLDNGEEMGVNFNHEGLHRFQDDKYEMIEGGETFSEMPVLSWLRFGDKEVVGTSLNGLYVKQGGVYKHWDTPASDFLAGNQLNCGLILNDSLCAYGSILDGLIIIDRQGEIVEHINMESGLQNNTILSIHADMELNLWLGLDNGLARVELNSPFRYFFDATGRLGAVYDARQFGEYLYLGTNHGLFYYPMKELYPLKQGAPRLRLVEGTQGQVWELKIIDGKLFCGHNNGTYMVEVPAGAAHKISNVSGGWSLDRLDEEHLVQGTYIGLAVYHKDEDGSWRFLHRIKGFQEPVRYVASKGKDVVWASHNQKGVYKVICTQNLDSALKVKYYDKSHGLPGDYNIHLFKIRDRIVFTTSGGLYSYDELNDSIFRFDKLNGNIPDYNHAHRIIAANQGKWWFITPEKAALVHIDPEFNAHIIKELEPPKGLRIENYENVIDLGAGSCFTLSGGVMFFPNDTAVYSVASPLRFRVEKVEAWGKNARKYKLFPLSYESAPELKANQNNVSITFSNAVYTRGGHVYQTLLKGLEDEWSFPEATGQRTFTNLPSGEYQFWVRLKDTPDTAEILYSFRITPPLHQTWWAFGLYFLVLTIVLILALWLQRLHLDKQKAELEQKQAEELERQRLLAESRIMALENEKLESELMHKAREISSSALELSGKNRLLVGLKAEIERIRSESNVGKASFNRLLNLIDTNLKRRDDWKLFEANFNHMNSVFYKQLSAGYPNLTSKDLRFCAFLKMNLTTKELASLLNISARSVELRRYRLRKRLNLNHEDNLVEFLMGFEEHGVGLE